MEPKSNRLIDVINWGRELFLTRRFPHARYTIEVLLEHVLGKRRVELYCDHDYRLTPREMERLRGFVEKRLQHRPLWHLVGAVDFFGARIRVDERVLIPRPETELLVEQALRVFGGHAGGLRYVADIGTGSGNIAIALALARSDLFIYATDLSPDAAALAESNARMNGVDGAIAFMTGDLLSPFRGRGLKRLDMIVSNPPYVSAADWEELPQEVKDREPRLALYGGSDGLDLVRRLVDEAPRYLKEGGHLLCEVGRGQASLAAEHAERAGAYGRAAVYRDYAGIERVVHAVVRA